MAKIQTRRTISFNRGVHAAIMAEADKRGLTAAHFVELLVRKAIRGLPDTHHVTPALARLAVAVRSGSVPKRTRKPTKRAAEKRATWTDVIGKHAAGMLGLT